MIWPRQPTVYPRVCGGSRSSAVSVLRPRGLSPRVRGKRWAWEYKWGETRSIPACAGEAPDDEGTDGPGGVYPRVCGGSGVFAF